MISGTLGITAFNPIKAIVQPAVIRAREPFRDFYPVLGQDVYVENSVGADHLRYARLRVNANQHRWRVGRNRAKRTDGCAVFARVSVCGDDGDTAGYAAHEF